MPDPLIAVDDRLVLRGWRTDDVPALFETIVANRRHLQPWLDWAHEWASYDRPRAFVERVRAEYEQGTGLELALTLDGRIVGAAGLAAIDRRAGTAEVGYWVARAEQGRGLVTRACVALAQHAFGEVGLRDLVIRIATENARSRAVAERVGAVLVGIRARVDPPERGRSGDEAVYVLGAPRTPAGPRSGGLRFGAVRPSVRQEPRG